MNLKFKLFIILLFIHCSQVFCSDTWTHIVSTAVLLYQFPDQYSNYSYIENIQNDNEAKTLFSSIKNINRSDANSIRDGIYAIIYAAYITIDSNQIPTKINLTRKCLEELKEIGINISENDLKTDGGAAGNNHHYTHSGWIMTKKISDNVFGIDKNYDNIMEKDIWNNRKNVLKNTLKKVLFLNDNQAEALGGIIFYTHILYDLRDNRDDKNLYTWKDPEMPSGNSGWMERTDVIGGHIEKLLNDLFPQRIKGSVGGDYEKLIGKIREAKEKSRQSYSKGAEDMINALFYHFPRLLQTQTDSFYRFKNIKSLSSPINILW